VLLGMVVNVLTLCGMIRSDVYLNWTFTLIALLVGRLCPGRLLLYSSNQRASRAVRRKGR